MKTFFSQEEAFDKAKEVGLTPEKAAKSIREILRGRFAFCDQTRGEPVKPEDWKPPDFRSLIQVSQTEQGRSEVSCVIDHEHPRLITAKPMIFTDHTRPSHFTFANHAGVQTKGEGEDTSLTPNELRRILPCRCQH